MERRTLLKGAGAGLIAVAVAGGGMAMMTPAQAKAKSAPYSVLTANEVVTLEALGEVLLPGAAAEGIAHFVDSQLAAPSADCLLILRYLEWPAPYAPFYKGCLAALDGVSQSRFGKPFAKLSPAQGEELIGAMSTGQLADWKGPPAPLFYMAARSDAVDVVYGTVEGFKKLGVPYMAHIEPETPW